MTDEQYLTVDQVAQRLQVSARTVRRWLAEGQLRATRFGRNVRVAPTDLRRFIDQETNSRPRDD